MAGDTFDVIVIGAGPAGLAAALAAHERGARRVALLDREEGPGGVLKQCIHTGFGLQTFGTDLAGPEYADRYWQQVAATDIDYRPQSMVIDLSPSGELTVVSPQRGPERLQSKAVVMATGCRERTRGNLAIAGSRPAGVLTAGSAQRMVNQNGYLPGRRAVILGSGDIGLIMARRLTLEGAEVLRVVEILPYAAGLPRNVVQCLHDWQIPLQLRSTVTRIIGAPRLEAVEVTALDSGQTEIVPCDLLLLSVGLICENELASLAGVQLDPLTGGAVVDERLATSVPGLYAAGNSLHVSDLVDYVSGEGQVAGQQAAAYALGETGAAPRQVHIAAGEGIRYAVPQQVNVTDDEDTVTLSFRVRQPLHDARFALWQGDRLLATRKERVAVPGQLNRWTVERGILARADGPCRLEAQGTAVEY